MKEFYIYVIGDVIGGFQLVYVVLYEGIIVVEYFVGFNLYLLDLMFVLKCIYLSFEVVSVGLIEDEVKENGYNVKVGKFLFMVIGKVFVYGESDGFVKIVVDCDMDDIFGVYMIGFYVIDMILEVGFVKVLDVMLWEVG